MDEFDNDEDNFDSDDLDSDDFSSDDFGFPLLPGYDPLPENSEHIRQCPYCRPRNPYPSAY